MHRVTAADYRKILSLLATAMIMLLANGLQGTLVPVRAHEAGFTDTAISLIGAAYFTGFVSGCFLGPRLIHRVGHIRAFAILGGLTAAVVLIHALIVNPYHVEECADALQQELTMPPPEQRERMASLSTTVREFNIYRWAGRMLSQSAHLRQRQRIEARVQRHSES